MSLFQKNIKYLIHQHRLDEKFISHTHFSAEELEKISVQCSYLLDHLVNRDIEAMEAAKAKPIKLLILDIDGVLTEAGMFFSEQGDEMKRFSAKDGMGIKELTKKGFLIGIISGGILGGIIEKRAKMLKIPLVKHSSESKIETLNQWCKEYDIKYSEVAMIGDDINDLEVMQTIGLPACPSDAVDQVKNVSKIVLSKKGGHGAVREFIDLYLNPVII